MQIIKVDPRALKENPDRMRQSKSSPQADALMLATIKAVGIVQPPVVAPEADGGNGYIIDAGHRRVRLAIAAGLEEIEILVVDFDAFNLGYLFQDEIATDPFGSHLDILFGQLFATETCCLQRQSTLHQSLLSLCRDGHCSL